MIEIDLGSLEHDPHANLIREMATKCYADGAVQAIWVGGSLAAGTGDVYSDVDFRIAVEPGQIDRWANPDWQHYLPIRAYGGTFMQFGEQALLHHLVLADKLTADQHDLLGLPSRTPAETVSAIDAIRAEMARVGRWLADQYEFAYPQ